MFEDMLKGVSSPAGTLDPRDIMTMNPLVLAYIGDAVYELFIRTFMIAGGPTKSVHKLHMMSTEYVKAHAQSEIIRGMTGMLTEDEIDIVRRGRNSKSGYVPKNADVQEYRSATGFEALIGYLYLTGNIKRLDEILNYSVSYGQEL